MLLSQKERNALKIKKQNPSLKDNYYGILHPDEYDNKKCKTLRIHRTKRKVLLQFTKANSLQEAIIIALCTMLKAKNNEEKTAKEISTDGQTKKNKYLCKQVYLLWATKDGFLKKQKILTEITKDKNQNLTLIEPFMGAA